MEAALVSRVKNEIKATSAKSSETETEAQTN